MSTQPAFDWSSSDFKTLSPYLEMGAYEALWDQSKMSFKRVADIFRQHDGVLPSDIIEEDLARDYASRVVKTLNASGVRQFGVRINSAGEYPAKLRDADHPVELLYYAGTWEMVEAPAIAVVGARKPTREGRARARKLVRNLADDGYTIVSGLASGIDSEVHREALRIGAQTIAVIGTPLSHQYPPKNAELQRKLAEDYLVISQVPVIKYEQQDFRTNRFFFPERNKTMSALTKGTIIVEASETSGTLIQARAALAQGRELFILESCFRNPDITWPAKFEKKGAKRVKDYEDIKAALHG